MSEHRIKVSNGKYEFHQFGGHRINVLRYGGPWVTELDGANAVSSMMAELDAARVIIAAARALVISGEAPMTLRDAIEKHSHFCDDREAPSPWAT